MKRENEYHFSITLCGKVTKQFVSMISCKTNSISHNITIQSISICTIYSIGPHLGETLKVKTGQSQQTECSSLSFRFTGLMG